MTEELGKNCKNCPLNNSGSPVHTHGNLKEAKVIFVGEAPGEVEQEQGLPFVGKAGLVLKDAISKYKFDSKDIAFGNIVRCRPLDYQGKNRKPEEREIRRCVKYLKKELEEFNGLVVILGAVALSALLGRKVISKSRGYGFIKDRFIKDKESKKDKFVGVQKYFVTWHPAYLLWAKSERRLGWEKWEKEFDDDIRKVKVWLDGKFKLKYTMVDDLTKLCNFLLRVDEEIRQNGVVELSFDTETMGFNMFDPKIEMLGLSFTSDFQTWFIPLEHPESPFKGRSKEVMSYLSPLFTNKNIRLIIQHAKFDLKFIRKKYGIIARNLYFDTKVAHFLIVGKFVTHKLTGMAWKYTDLGGYDIDASNLVNTPLKEVAYYGAMDSYVTFKLRKKFESMMDKNMMTLLTDIISLAIMAVTEIEVDGLKLDEKRLDEFYNKYAKNLQRLETRMHEYPEIVEMEKETEALVNFNSPTQLREVFVAMNLCPSKRTKKTQEVSTDVDALQELKGQHQFINDLMEYRRDVKIFGTYLKPYKERQIEE